MPRKLPSEFPTQRVHAALRRLGFHVAREGKHTIFARGADLLPVPRHARMRLALLAGELKRLGISEDEFMDAY